MIVPQLIEIHELAQLDVLSIEDCCIVFARVRQCERELNTGLTKDTDRGPAKNAATTILNQYRTSYQRYMAEFGLSSMSRKRLNPREPEIPEDDSDLDETES
jgi:P27 family predicted phage terminase small subunit